MTTIWLMWIAGAYGLGSVPFGLMMGLWRGVDLRTAGSGNIGTTNTWRVLGRRLGVTCLVLDVLKGLGPVAMYGWQMQLLGQSDPSTQQAWQWLAVAAAAILGHVYPVWLRFQGGKGVATGFGALLGIWPVLTCPALAALVVWLIVVKVTRYVSLSSMAAAIVMPVAVGVMAVAGSTPVTQRWPFLAITAAMAVLVLVRHRTNIARLLAGTEPKTESSARGPS